MSRLLRLGLFFASAAILSAAPQATPHRLDRSRLPAGLREAPLNRLSSGALMMLDEGGDLVLPPRASNAIAEQTADASTAAAGAALDPRVGANIRLGDDPATLNNANCGTECAPRAQAEPHIIRSRSNLDLLVATFQEGRFTTGGALDCGYSVSRDGGLTWTRALLPGVTQLVGGPYYRATDPVVGIDLNNNVFINTDAATDPSFDHGEILVSKSTDVGNTFQAPVVVYSPAATGYFPDKNWMTVNTFAGTPTANRVLVTFTLFTTGSNSPLVGYYSDDQGETWNRCNSLGFITPANSSMQGSQPVYLPNGNAAVVYWNFGTSASPGERLEVITSNDGGANFGGAVRIANATEWVEPAIRSGTFLPNATTDRTTNSIYVVYQALFQNSPRIMFSKSSDGGLSWTSPIPVSDNPAGLGVFNPAIAAAPDGQALTVTFYDHRVSGNNGTIVDMFEAQSFDGGATWQPNIRLTNVSTDASLAPQSVDPDSNTARGYMIGDYLGVADPANRNIPAVPVFVDTRTGNPDPFVARIGIAPQFDFASWQAARLSYAQIQAPQYGLRQLNISTRDFVGNADDVLIGGFIITGPSGSTKRVMIRGLGPSLAASGVPNVLSDPFLTLVDNTANTEVVSNDNWQTTPNAGEIPSGFQPADTRESVIIATLNVTPAGAKYTAILKSAQGGTGNGLLELYDLDSAGAAQLANISTRGQVLTGDNVLIGGFIVAGGTGPSGTGSAKVVVRAIGPSLPSGTSPAPLQDPTLELHDASGTPILFDDNWRDSQQADIQATGLAPTDDRESAMVALVPPGNYTAVVRGKDNATGLALVEAYNVQ